MSEDPVRWLDDPDAPSDIVSDMAQSAADPGPTLDLSAGLEAIHATLEAGAGAGAAGAGTGGAAATKTGVSLKLITLVLGGVGLAAAGAYIAVQMNTQPPLPESSSAEVVPPPTGEDPQGGEQAEQAEQAEGRTLETTSEGTASVRQRRHRPRRRDRAEAPSHDDALQREIALLARARGALAAQPGLALSLSDRGHREFPDGVFYEEREATAVLALAALGRDRQAKRRGEAFLRRFPRGTFARRVRQSIDESDEPSGPE